MYQRRRHRRIHPAAQRADRPRAFGLLADRIHRRRNKSRMAPVLLRPAHRKNKILQHLRAAVGVIHLRMEFQAIKPLFRMLYRRHRVIRLPGNRKSRRQIDHMVAMAVPNFRSRRKTAENLRLAGNVQVRRPILPPRRPPHFSAQGVRHPLHAVANPQNRNPQLQHIRIAMRRVRVIHRTGAATQHDPHRLERADLLHLRRARQNRREYFLLADPPRNQLRILPAKIEHHNPMLGTDRGFLTLDCR